MNGNSNNETDESHRSSTPIVFLVCSAVVLGGIYLVAERRPFIAGGLLFTVGGAAMLVTRSHLPLSNRSAFGAGVTAIVSGLILLGLDLFNVIQRA